MAATLAGVCQVPLTSVLLLFELTQDYRIVLPLLGAVGLSSWVTSGQSKRKDVKKKKNEKKKSNEGNTQSPNKTLELSSASQIIEESSSENNLCEVESSLCLEDSVGVGIEELEKRTFVSQAMRTRYVTVLMSTSLSEAVTLMLVEKQACAVIVDGDNVLIGWLTLEEIQEFSKSADTRSVRPKVQFFRFY